MINLVAIIFSLLAVSGNSHELPCDASVPDWPHCAVDAPETYEEVVCPADPTAPNCPPLEELGEPIVIEAPETLEIIGEAPFVPAPQSYTDSTGRMFHYDSFSGTHVDVGCVSPSPCSAGAISQNADGSFNR